MDQCLFNQALLDIYGTNSSNSTATQKSSLLGFNSNNGGSGNGNGNAHHQIGLMNDGAALLENPYGALLGGLYDNDQSLKSYSFNLGDPIVANDKDLTNFGMFNMNSEADFINMANSEWDKNLVNIDKHQNNDDGSHIRNTNINGNSNGNSNANGNGNSKDEHNVIIDKLQEELQMLTRNCSGDNVVNTLATITK
ncbi:hypothetical protein PACTADRAFT_2480 [Pachysolen tannophilus NRRL Y-2460]|uniref:Uncharacterized protein n=1 Tax=Pachysolen tannophilus NRRL Y-2460 TaxID=669874 RepID=A0A1E4TX04_PACTA|nr:hypothetical protein PACTADRAFT_2480 [Pachysolen tannophilus NRRL Y-2460]